MDLLENTGPVYESYVDYNNYKIVAEEIRMRNRKMLFDDIVVFSL